MVWCCCTGDTDDDMELLIAHFDRVCLKHLVNEIHECITSIVRGGKKVEDPMDLIVFIYCDFATGSRHRKKLYDETKQFMRGMHGGGFQTNCDKDTFDKMLDNRLFKILVQKGEALVQFLKKEIKKDSPMV